MEYILLTEVSMRPESGCLAIAKTDEHGNSMTDPAQWAESVKMLLCSPIFVGNL